MFKFKVDSVMSVMLLSQNIFFSQLSFLMLGPQRTLALLFTTSGFGSIIPLKKEILLKFEKSTQVSTLIVRCRWHRWVMALGHTQNLILIDLFQSLTLLSLDSAVFPAILTAEYCISVNSLPIAKRFKGMNHWPGWNCLILHTHFVRLL